MCACMCVVHHSLVCGNVIEINPCQGLFVSCANWIPKIDMERKYNIEKNFLKLYFFESGEIYLIQNGKKTKKIMLETTFKTSKKKTRQLQSGETYSWGD